MGCSSGKSYASDSVAASSHSAAVARESSKDAVYLKQAVNTFVGAGAAKDKGGRDTDAKAAAPGLSGSSKSRPAANESTSPQDRKDQDLREVIGNSAEGKSAGHRSKRANGHRSIRALEQSSSRTRECRAPEDLAPGNPGARAPGHSRPKSSRPKSPRTWASEHRRFPSTVGLSELTSIRDWPSARGQSGTWAKYSTNPHIRAYHQSRI
mmetsp:Transcript_114367/g.186400  ORF Transcript_114367/g.186400 Transcript_114367/m.186400 type:complete len:209 (-) Transcript_114367:1036-1662(-)